MAIPTCIWSSTVRISSWLPSCTSGHPATDFEGFPGSQWHKGGNGPWNMVLICIYTYIYIYIHNYTHTYASFKWTHFIIQPVWQWYPGEHQHTCLVNGFVHLAFNGLPAGNQMWLAGKSPVVSARFHGNHRTTWRLFQQETKPSSWSMTKFS